MIPTNGSSASSSSAMVVVMDDLSVGYARQAAVSNLTLEVVAGSTTAIIGPNGSGKSTVLRAIAGLLEPLSGRINVAAGARRNPVAFVMQATDVSDSLPITVSETVRMASYSRHGLLGRMSALDRERIEDAIETMALDGLRNHQLHDLSGGQRQRALVAQGLAQHSEILLLDEPMTGLDVPSRQAIFAAVAAEREAGRTVLYSTHDLDDARRADQVLLLAGRCIAFGPPSEVLTSECLAEAFGTQMLRLEDGNVLVDDPHHDHDHSHGNRDAGHAHPEGD